MLPLRIVLYNISWYNLWLFGCDFPGDVIIGYIKLAENTFEINIKMCDFGNLFNKIEQTYLIAFQCSKTCHFILRFCFNN